MAIGCWRRRGSRGTCTKRFRIGAGAAQERGVVGETPNLAARLQALARPGTLVVADSTRRQIGTLFEIEDLGPQPLAGFAEPQRAWRVVGESGVVSRFEALRSGTTPLVGRDEELDLLLRRWQQAKSGAGRVVLVSERQTIQAEVGRAEALYRSGRAFLYNSVAESWAAVEAGREIGVTQLAIAATSAHARGPGSGAGG
jgi:hypothetical protein